ncbi:DUF4382 domain-containing protein [Saccharicrinis aurantiacus]|uniref:DUF4382 domain-containing protein n=1 Tax=Saccharicrinis aurantiacus TaxID=1849719 RepID=UPI00248F8D06|nr:DUF4382 domain-containing protein [Saccharicrinis aurantiacus]
MKNLFLMALVAILFTACNDNDSNSSNQNAKLSIRLTDAPADYEQVLIDVQEIHINASSEENSGWQELEVLNPGVYNLLDFKNGMDTLLVDQELPAGKISQMRLVLGDNNQIMVDGDLHNLDTPSAQQSGLKFKINAELVEGITYKLWIDFDAGRSIVEKGNGGYSLKPVIRTFTAATSGAIKGIVTPVEANTYIMAISASNDTASTFADEETGEFLIRGIEASTYKVDFVPNDDYQSQTIEDVNVTIGEVNDLELIELNEIE